MTWLTQVGPYKVTKRESARPGGQAYILLDNPRSLIVHTTEGTTVDGAWNTLNSKGAAPHFIVGENRIVQLRPLTAEAATVHNHNDQGWQVECVGSAKQTVHKLTPSSWQPLVALAHWFHEEKAVPLQRPAGWFDNCSDIKTTMASDNTRRQSRKALGFRGFLGHLDIPDQAPTWHWDPGALNYTALFAEIQTGDEDVSFAEYTDGIDAFWVAFASKGGDPGPPAATKPAEFRKGWGHARRSAANPKPGTPGVHEHSVTGKAQ
jgi:hypothetical protein